MLSYGVYGSRLKGSLHASCSNFVVDVKLWQKRGEHNDLEQKQIQVSSLIVLIIDAVSYERLKEVKEDIKSEE